MNIPKDVVLSVALAAAREDANCGLLDAWACGFWQGKCEALRSITDDPDFARAADAAFNEIRFLAYSYQRRHFPGGRA